MSESNYATVASQIGTGTAWLNPNDIVGGPGNYASVKLIGLTAPNGQTLIGTGYGFSVSEGSLVKGIQVGFWAYHTGAAGPHGATLEVSLYNAGSLIGIGKVQALTTTPTFYTLGSPTDIWGLDPVTVTAIVQSSEFGAAISAGGGGLSRGQLAEFYISSLPISITD